MVAHDLCVGNYLETNARRRRTIEVEENSKVNGVESGSKRTNSYVKVALERCLLLRGDELYSWG